MSLICTFLASVGRPAVVSSFPVSRSTTTYRFFHPATTLLSHPLSRMEFIATANVNRLPLLNSALFKSPDRSHSKRQQKRNIITFMSTDDDNNDNDVKSSTTPNTKLNIKGLKTETTRLIYRCLKKISQFQTRYNNAVTQMEDLLANPDASISQLDACPNPNLIKTDMTHWQDRLTKLRQLEEELKILPSASELPPTVVALVTELEVSDGPPARNAPKKKKVKGPKSEAPRLPYRRYESHGVEIRVGKRADDNDELSINPKHRDDGDWWMHASGCPGSHVVIRSSQPSEEVINDAAALAARQSKCNGQVIKVSLTKCRNVSKPFGAKAGLVMLNGNVRTIRVEMREAEKRLERLDKTVVIN